MALFDDAVVREVAALVQQRYQELGAALGKDFVQEGLEQLNHESWLRSDLDVLIRVANGEYTRTGATKVQIRQVETALAHLLELLLGNVLHSRVIIPDDFWQTQMGVLVSRARWWISVDDLITISNAAALAFGENTQANRMRIARAIDSEQLEWVPDPSVVNPQQNRRVLRPQVERLRDQRQLPE